MSAPFMDVRTGVLMIAVVLSGSCARRGTVSIDPDGLKREWTLVQLRDSAGEARLVPESRVTLRFTGDGRVGGRSSINQFGGSAGLKSDGTISWSAMTSTLMAGPQELMVQERRFLAALEATRRFELAQGRLTLSDSADRVVLRFVASDSSEVR